MARSMCGRIPATRAATSLSRSTLVHVGPQPRRSTNGYNQEARRNQPAAPALFWHCSSDDRCRSVSLEQLCRSATKQSGAVRCALNQTDRFGVSEMNWPDGPDPFEYREHRNEVDRV